MNGWISCAFQVGGALVLVACIMPLFIVALIPIAVSLFYLSRFYLTLILILTRTQTRTATIIP